jgi:hypothetical protein
MNQTAGLFGGLLIGIAILAGYAWYLYEQGQLTLPGSSSGTTNNPNLQGGAGTPGLGGSDGAGGWGNFGASVQGALSTSPYQLVNNGSGVSIATAAQLAPNESPMLSLPVIAPLAPTVPSIIYQTA